MLLATPPQAEKYVLKDQTRNVALMIEVEYEDLQTSITCSVIDPFQQYFSKSNCEVDSGKTDVSKQPSLKLHRLVDPLPSFTKLETGSSSH